MSASAISPESKQPGDGFSFVHSSLDDYGLKPAEFRVYCHVNRVAGKDGVCWKALENIAKHCGYSINRTRKALKMLTRCRIISKKYVKGEGNDYRLNPPEKWLPGKKQPLPKSDRGTKKHDSTPTKKRQGNPSRKVTGKVTPSEGTPNKGGSPKLFPSKLPGAIMEQKTEILKLDNEQVMTAESIATIKLLIEKLRDFEDQKYGAPRTTLPECPTAQDMEKLMCALRGDVATGRNKDTYNATRRAPDLDEINRRRKSRIQDDEPLEGKLVDLSDPPVPKKTPEEMKALGKKFAEDSLRLIENHDTGLTVPR